MKTIYNIFIPVPGYMAMLTLFILWIKKEYKGDKRLNAQFFNHEKIHSYQQIEIWGVALIVMVLFCTFTSFSWWWLIATPVFPLVIYVVCWLIEIALPPYNQAYRNICFESEAIYNEADLNYCKRRKLFTFRFLKYTSNRKYPYLSWEERRKR